MEEAQRLMRRMWQWVRAAKPTQSYGALPDDLKKFVQLTALTDLRAIVPNDIKVRVINIKRREQNQRALQQRRQETRRRASEAAHDLDVYRAQCWLVTGYVRGMREYEAHLASADGNDLFGPAVQATLLFRNVHARRDNGTFGVAVSPEAGAADGEGEFSGGSVSERVLANRSKKRRVAVGAAVGEEQVLRASAAGKR